jgi:hypothetical protein
LKFSFWENEFMLGFYRATHFALQIAGLTHALQRQRSDRGNESRIGARSRAYSYATERRERDEERRIRFRPWPVAGRVERGSGLPPHGNFPPCKALKTHEMWKESRFCPSRAADEQGATRGPRPSTIRTCSIRLGRSRGIVGWLDGDRQSTAAARRSGKFSALQSLENSQNANGISFRDDPINLISPGASLSRVAPPPGSFRRCPIGHRPTRLPTARPDVQRSSAIREATRRAGWFAKWRLARVTAVY